MENVDVRNAQAVYFETLVKMADMEGPAGVGIDRPRGWNRLVTRLQEARKEITATEEGRLFISSLLDEPRPTVRGWAAGHALHWGDARARDVLEAMSVEPRLGLHRLNAEMTLREFDAGRLDPDW